MERVIEEFRVVCRSDVAERLKQLELLQIKWEEFEKDVNALNNWFRDQTARLDKFHNIGHDVSVQHAITECKVRPLNCLESEQTKLQAK